MTSAPLPPARPPDLGVSPAPRRPDLSARPASPTPVSAPVISDEDEAACFERLDELGVTADVLPPLSDGDCAAEHPLRLSLLPDGIAVAPATVNCRVAEALAQWTQDVVTQEAETHLQSRPKRVVIGDSYSCRGRNRQPGAKLSEHAFANAIDVMGFEFDARPAVSIKPQTEDTPEARFQAAIRSRACAYFTTVLGPGADEAHVDHLHLDLRGRRGVKHLCQ
jgi:hypothetical protein